MNVPKPDKLAPFLCNGVVGLLIVACQQPTTPGAEAVSTGSGTGAGTMPATATLDTPTTASDYEAPVTTGTTSSTAGEVVSSSGAETGATTGFLGCGDGVVDVGEECDDFLDGNADSKFCTEDCTLNVCGDGKLFAGWELCDEGEANSDEYGSLCGAQCEPGARCGDGKLQAEFETCDLGPNNGGVKGDEQGILCDAGCRALRLRAFVTEGAFAGDLGGLFGADLKCQAAAKAAGLPTPERFHAYLSTGEIDAKDRFKAVAASRPYVLVTGKKVADNFASLIAAGPLGEGISVTEHGATLYSVGVATNTALGGLRFSPDKHCQGWTSAEPVYQGRVGLSGVPMASPDFAVWKSELRWTGAQNWTCNKAAFHLYCLEI